MAGLVDTTNQPVPTTISDAQSQIDALDASRNVLRGDQQANIKDLFSYDKTLADRYSSPDSKMFIEDAGKREQAISGYFGAGKGQVTNLFDIMESVRTASDNLKNVLDQIKKAGSSGSGSGSGSLSLSDFNDFLGKDAEAVPQPPQNITDAVAKDPTKAIYYHKEADGTYYFAADPKGKPSAPWLQEWSPEVSQTVDRAKILSDNFGIDKATLAKLNAVATFNPKLANTLLTSMISSGVKTTPTKDTDGAISDIKSGFANATDAQAYIDQNKSAMVAKGLDVERLQREVTTYFAGKKKTGSSTPLF